jgi:hypothetical protein
MLHTLFTSISRSIHEEDPIVDKQTVSYKRNDQVLYKLPPAFLVNPQSRTFEEDHEVWVYNKSSLKEKIVLSRKSLLNMYELFKLLKLEGWAIPSLEVKDLLFNNETIKLARPYRLVKDPSHALLMQMQRSINKFFPGECLNGEEGLLFKLLGCGIDPLEVEKCLPMFYSVDRQIIFIFVVSNSRTTQGPIYTEINWVKIINGTSLKKELKRQSNFYRKKGKPNFFNRTI